MTVEPIRVDPEALLECLEPLQPRLYSISSAPSKYPQEIHLTVAVVRYETNGRQREGVCSSYLADRARMNEADLPIFVADSHFGLPADDNVPVIMVGPGTGIAPFRAFLEERAATKATIITSQLPIEHWHAWVGDATIADAMLDRLLQRHHLRHHPRRRRLHRRLQHQDQPLAHQVQA